VRTHSGREVGPISRPGFILLYREGDYSSPVFPAKHHFDTLVNGIGSHIVDFASFYAGFFSAVDGLFEFDTILFLRTA